MAVAYIPDVEHGEQIYNEIDRVNGRNVDYNNIGLIIPYTWNDFTDLVQYEREQKISPYYSAMIATNLPFRSIQSHCLWNIQECLRPPCEAFIFPSTLYSTLHVLCLKLCKTASFIAKQLQVKHMQNLMQSAQKNPANHIAMVCGVCLNAILRNQPLGFHGSR
mgnify:CR=1 FL=1